jgi:hypothetical protein
VSEFCQFCGQKAEGPRCGICTALSDSQERKYTQIWNGAKRLASAREKPEQLGETIDRLNKKADLP